MRLAVLVGIAEVGIQSVGIEIDVHAGVIGAHHGLAEGQGIGRAKGRLAAFLAGLGANLGPVIAVAAQGHDGAVGVQMAQGFGHMGLEPGLGGGRARLASLEMLVEGHEDQGVGIVLQGLERPGLLLVHRRGDPQFTA